MSFFAARSSQGLAHKKYFLNEWMSHDEKILYNNINGSTFKMEQELPSQALYVLCLKTLEY